MNEALVAQLIPMWGLAILFLLVAFAYSSVGLGGGSAYTALMAITGISLLSIPTLSLTLNLLVSTLGTYHFIRHRHANFGLILPFLVSSMPMAYIGGSLQLEKQLFQYILLVSLVIVAARIYLWRELSFSLHLSAKQQLSIALISGSILGLVAGIVGIGGGIYLIPLILIFNLGTAKQAAACAAIFIFLTSLTGLLARLTYHPVDLVDYWPLGVAVILGGFVGSRLGSTRFSPLAMERVLGIIILSAIVLLTIKLVR